MRVVLAVLVALVLAVPAAARLGPVQAPANVTVLAAEGGRAAFLAASANGGCGAVRIWLPPAKVTRTPVVCGPRTSTGRGAYGLSLSNGMPLWVTYAGGNIREHTVWRGGRQVMFLTHDVDSPSPLLVGERGVYAVGNTATVFVGKTGTRTWVLDDKPLALAAGTPFGVVRLASGAVERITTSTGDVDARWDYAKGEARAAKISGDTVAVLRVGEIDVYTSSRDTMRSWPVPAARSYGDDYCGVVRCALAALRLADLHGDLAVYIDGRDLHVLRVTDGRDVVLRRPPVGPVHAQLESTGLFYSAGRDVYLIPRSELNRRLR